MATFLLIPGLICDGHVWESTKAALEAEDLTCVVADVSEQPSITRMADDLLLRHPGDLVVVGHSMGARVAMEMAHLSPERISGLALLSTGAHPLAPGEIDKREHMIALAHADGMDALAERWLPGMMAQGLEPDPVVLAGLKDMVLRKTPEIHERQLRALIGRPDARQTIGSFNRPVLLLVGRCDQWSPVSQHEEIAALCKNARLEVIENGGHFVPVEKPDETATTILDWTRSLPGSLC